MKKTSMGVFEPSQPRRVNKTVGALVAISTLLVVLSVSLYLAKRQNEALQAQAQILKATLLASGNRDDLDKVSASIAELAEANEELQSAITILVLYNEGLSERIAVLRGGAEDSAVNPPIVTGETLTAESSGIGQDVDTISD